jgi:hypothetical protein
VFALRDRFEEVVLMSPRIIGHPPIEPRLIIGQLRGMLIRILERRELNIRIR